MKEILVLVRWCLNDNPDITFPWIELPLGDVDDNFIYLSLQGVDEISDWIIGDVGVDVFEEKDHITLINYIKNLRHPISQTFPEFMHWVQPTFGSFFVVLTQETWKTNHPEEWDMNINFIGILGEQVKLVY